MKKTWIAVVVALLALAYPASAWLIGKNVQSAMKINAERALESAPYLKVVNRKYQGGVFSSTEESTIEVAGELFRSIEAMQTAPTENSGDPSEEQEAAAPAVPMKPILITIRNHIKHGPVAGGSLALAKVDTELVFEDKIQQEITKAFAGKKPLEISTTMNFAGGGTSILSSPPASVSIKEGTTKVSWLGLRGTADFTKDMASYKSDVSSAGLEMSGGPKNEVMKMSDLRVVSDKKRLPGLSMFYLGKDNGTIKQMSFSSAGEPNKAIMMNDITYLGDVTEAGGYIDIAAKMGATKLTVGADGYGPAHYDLSLRHLHTQTFEKIMKSLAEFYSRKHKSLEDMSNATLDPWKKFGPELLQHHPEIVIDRISFTTVDGEAMIKGSVKAPTATAADATNSAALLGKLQAQVDVVLPDGMLMKFSGAGKETDEEKAMAAEMMIQQLQGLEQQGYVTRADKLWKSRLEWKDGQVTVNGKPFQMPGAPAPEQ